MRAHEPNSDAVVLLNGAKAIARIPAPVGPVGSFFEALWSPEGKYVAINKQRSSRAGGDEMWIVALPTGKVLRQPDDALWNKLYEKADAFIDEKHLTETSGKVFLTLTAIGWEKDRLRFKLEAGFSELEDQYPFEGTLIPPIEKFATGKFRRRNHEQKCFFASGYSVRRDSFDADVATMGYSCADTASLHPLPKPESISVRLPQWSAKCDCIDHGRRHVDLQIGGCDLRKALLWIVVPQGFRTGVGPRNSPGRANRRNRKNRIVRRDPADNHQLDHTNRAAHTFAN